MEGRAHVQIHGLIPFEDIGLQDHLVIDQPVAEKEVV
jgi:hypothetical protein